MIKVIYWSGTGNTEKMAMEVAEGINQTGQQSVVKAVSEVSAADVAQDLFLALGCPAMGAEVLEEDEMEPFMCELEKQLSGKNVALFGSYGWGDGSWMRDWEERVKAAGANLVMGEGVIANDEPDEEAVEKCKALGKALAELI